jgi:hypothetical protein
MDELKRIIEDSEVCMEPNRIRSREKFGLLFLANLTRVKLDKHLLVR